jgi:hypothetical protein
VKQCNNFAANHDLSDRAAIMLVIPFPPPTNPPTNHPVDVGMRSEAAILLRLIELGYQVLVPHGVNHRYDFVLDQGDRFLRIQCKTGRLRNGAIYFNPHSIRSNRREVLVRSYVGEIDHFAVFCRDTDGVYLVPCEHTGRGPNTLRVLPPANNQQRRIRWAADYELPKPERGLEPLHSSLQVKRSTS